VQYADTIGVDNMPSFSEFERMYNESGAAWHELALKFEWKEALKSGEIEPFTSFEAYKAMVDGQGESGYNEKQGISKYAEYKNEQYTQSIKWGVQVISVRIEGQGFFGKRTQQSNPRVDTYELKINPNNESYYLKHPKGGYVQYENKIDNVVMDGKLIMQQKSFYHVIDLPEFARNKVLNEAIRQVEAASSAGYTVEWLISDSKAVVQLIRFFKDNNIDIIVRYLPE
jgi:hypothetical protein